MLEMFTRTLGKGVYNILKGYGCKFLEHEQAFQVLFIVNSAFLVLPFIFISQTLQKSKRQKFGRCS